MPRMLSENFSLDELTLSQTAARLGIDNTPDKATLKNLEHLAAQLEIVRKHLGGVSIHISSGYRSPALNRAVKGSAKSAHVLGLAVDFTAPRFGTVLQTSKATAASGIEFDQVIYEYGRWVHLGVSAPGTTAKAELLSIMVAGQFETGLRNVG